MLKCGEADFILIATGVYRRTRARSKKEEIRMKILWLTHPIELIREVSGKYLRKLQETTALGTDTEALLCTLI